MHIDPRRQIAEIGDGFVRPPEVKAADETFDSFITRTIEAVAETVGVPIERQPRPTCGAVKGLKDGGQPIAD